MESILITIRTMLGIEDDYDGFDAAIVAGINSAIFSLSQLGIGPPGGMTVIDESQTWDVLFNSVPNLQAVKSYIWLKTRLEFDPPSTSYLIQAIERNIQQLEWRLQVEVDADYVAPT